jgi:hypothetical protein
MPKLEAAGPAPAVLASEAEIEGEGWDWRRDLMAAFNSGAAPPVETAGPQYFHRSRAKPVRKRIVFAKPGSDALPTPTICINISSARDGRPRTDRTAAGFCRTRFSVVSRAPLRS